jgi:hypothetical protein
MASPERLARAQEVVANVYTSEKPDLFPFLQRTGTGFWTWTMLHHFFAEPTTEVRDRMQALAAAEEIAGEVKFIHQESLDRDVETILDIPARSGPPLNASERGAEEAGDEVALLVDRLDGDIAQILGGYACCRQPALSVGP